MHALVGYVLFVVLILLMGLFCLYLLGVFKPATIINQNKDSVKSVSAKNKINRTPPPVLCATAAFVLNYRDHNGDLTGRRDFGLVRSDLRICLLTENSVWFYDYRNQYANVAIRMDHDKIRPYGRDEKAFRESLRDSLLKKHFVSASHVDAELFGDLNPMIMSGYQGFIENRQRYRIKWAQDGDFHWLNTQVRALDQSASWLGALKAIGALNTQEDMLTLYHLSVDSDRQVSTGYSAGDLQPLIDEANYDLDRKLINAVRSLMVTALMRRNLISGIAEADATLESAMQTLTRKAENSPAGMEAQRLRDRATRTKTVLSDSLSLINEQERRIMACIERVREYKIEVNDRSAEALVAAEAGKAATNAVEMTIRLTGGMTSREEIDSDSILVTSIVQELKNRISAVNSLVKQIRSDTSLDADTAGVAIPIEHEQAGN